MTETESEHAAKRRAAEAAAALVEDGMAVGLGTGSTATLLVRRLGERVAREGLRIVAVPTSNATAELAGRLGIPLRDVDEVDVLDINIDGADEVDPRFVLIKGRGGALLREKIVASTARKRVTIVTPNKRVERLGAHAPIPVEVSPFGLRHTALRLRALGAETAVRLGTDGSPYVTDGGNRIIDCRFERVDNPEELDARLQSQVGVFETGLFIGLCDVLVIGHPDEVEVVESHARSRLAN